MVDASHLRIITWKELQEIVRYSRQHVGRREKQGTFPKRIRLGKGRVGWFLHEIEQWVLEQARLSGKGDQAFQE